MKRLPTRFIVSKSIRNQQELVLDLLVTFEINHTIVDIYKCILRGHWKNLKIQRDDFINIFGAKIESQPNENNNGLLIILIVDNENGLIVLRPDVLLPITTLMESSYCMRKAWISRIFDIYGEPNKALLIGIIVHEIFQESLRRKEFSVAQIENFFVKELIFEFTLDLYALNMKPEDLIEVVKPYFKTISQWLSQYNDKTDNKALFHIQRLHEIENPIWSTKYGLIGKIDLTLNAMFQDKNNMSKTFKLTPLELKTGRHTFSTQHVGQIILYSFIMCDKYVNIKPSDGFLLYLKDECKTEQIKTNHHVFRDLIVLRNQFIPFYDKLGIIDETNKDIILKGPETLNSDRNCSKCEHNLDCSLLYRCFDWNPFENDQNHFSFSQISHLKNIEIEFFSEMVSLLEIEKQHCLVSDEFVNFWNFRSEQCEFCGIGLSRLKIKYQDSKKIVFCRSPKVIESNQMKANFFQDNPNLIMNFSLLENRQAVISEEMINPTKSFEIYGNFCKQLCVSIGAIDSFSEDLTEVTIHLEKEQINLLNPIAIYRLDFLKNLSTKATKINFSNLLRLMAADDPKAAELREVVIHARIPKFNLNDCKILSFNQIINSPILAKLNIQQRKCILGIVKTKSSLIFGSPGSGKTQTIVALIQIMVRLGYSVLVTSFTHVAVDNILLKLIKNIQENGNSIDFVRMGSVKRIHRDLYEYSDHFRTKHWLKTGDVNALNNFYSSIPIVAATCLGIYNHPLFSKRTFDFCIIDEASQVFLTTSLGPLFNCHNFVLVGDQKQLPPVVQSIYARKNGLDESLFARLLSKTGKLDLLDYDIPANDVTPDDALKMMKKSNSIDLKSIRIFPLFIQYRMNSVIMEVANKLTYSGKLKCGNKEIENISMQDFLLDARRDMLKEFDQSYLSKVISPILQDSVIFIDTCGIKEAIEIRSIERSSSQKNDIQNRGDKPENLQAYFVYNDFEARLIIRIIQMLLFTYNKDNFKADNIGVISPFRRQVSRLKEIFGTEFLEQNHLEINTVDSYQGRDKDVIIYSCVKSSGFSIEENLMENDSQLSNEPLVDSELLKDERRLNVAVTRAKRKLIIVGNRNTLSRYLPFKNLFNVLQPNQFVRLVDYHKDINDLF